MSGLIFLLHDTQLLTDGLNVAIIHSPVYLATYLRLMNVHPRCLYIYKKLQKTATNMPVLVCKEWLKEVSSISLKMCVKEEHQHHFNIFPSFLLHARLNSPSQTHKSQNSKLRTTPSTPAQRQEQVPIFWRRDNEDVVACGQCVGDGDYL